jgi:starch synthase
MSPSRNSAGNVVGRAVPSPPPGGGNERGAVGTPRPTGQQQKILFIAAECTPFAKIGGKADVVAGLAKALRRLGHDARVVIPLYASIDRAKHNLQPGPGGCVHMGNNIEHWFGTAEGRIDDEVPVWFIDYDSYFGRPGLYDGPYGHYHDNAYRFAMLSKAALQLCKDRPFIPDIVHLHDWPTALAAVFLKTWDRILSPLSDTASVLTIHNVGHQGQYPADVFAYIGISGDHFTPDKFEDHRAVNLLKAGIHFADAITTVSPAHAQEILTPEGGLGLAPFLNNRRADLFGILNGVDYDHWNPAIDQHLPARFTPTDLTGKSVCKAALQQQFNLELRPEVPVFGIVSRFAHQKGFTLLRDVLPATLNEMSLQLVVLGEGDADTENFFRWLQSAYPGRVGAHIGFAEGLSHLIEAGSDFFLMPSLYEPCGLNQIYSLKYGTLPIVRATGGLTDTVINYDEATGQGTGFQFWNATPAALHNTIGWAVATWFDRPRHIAQLRQQAMAQNFGWQTSAQRYLEVYRHARRNQRRA